MGTAATIRQKFDRTFTLSEEDLLKLHELVDSRIGGSPSSKSEFKVRRQDGMLATFDSASGLLAEDHAPRNPIESLTLFASNEIASVELSFDMKEDVTLEIEASQRDVAYLLLADVRDYLKGEVIRKWGFPVRSTSAVKFLLLAVLMSVSFIALLLHDIPADRSVELKGVLATQDITPKLNFLLQEQARRSDRGDPRYFIAWMLAFLILPWLTGPVMRLIFPDSVFYWGKVAAKFDKRQERRSKIWWGVVIAFLVGIASAVATDSFKKNPFAATAQGPAADVSGSVR